VADRSKGLDVSLEQDAPIPLNARLRCEPGQVLALVGPSGSGKSTILSAIAGLRNIANGRISCNGSVWYDSAKHINMATRLRRVGFVFQSYALFPHLSALANVMEGLGSGYRGSRENRARELLELVRLGGLEARRPSELSGGQQQRVAVARALARDPNVLLLDEPFSSVDRVTRQRLHRELGHLRGELQMPIVLVTHDLEEAVQLGDRMSILHRGHTLQEGAPRDIMARPANREVARLVDLKNIFQARIAAQRPGAGITALVWGSTTLEAGYAPGFAAGDLVDWVIPSGRVILHRRRRPSRGIRENPVRGRVESMVALGDTVTVAIKVDSLDGYPLFMSMPVHAAERNSVAPGERVGVSLIRDDIHIMPAQQSETRDDASADI